MYITSKNFKPSGFDVLLKTQGYQKSQILSYGSHFISYILSLKHDIKKCNYILLNNFKTLTTDINIY